MSRGSCVVEVQEDQLHAVARGLEDDGSMMTEAMISEDDCHCRGTSSSSVGASRGKV
jgi:hypothetical protein